MKRTNQKTFLVINNLLKFNDFATATTRKTVFWGCVRVEHVLSLKNSIIVKKKMSKIEDENFQLLIYAIW